MFMSKRNPVLLDLFCKAGGAAKGYYDAGFEVVGVDIEPQPRYPYKFVQYDALKFLQEYDLSIFDAIHASPPCQYYCNLNYVNKKDYPDLVKQTRFLLLQTELPYIIENVIGAPLLNPIMLCGTMFGLGVIRHRLFESNILLETPTHKSHHKQKEFELDFSSVYGNGFNASKGRIDMGINWMIKDELSQAIPPAYTKHIGDQLINYVRHKCAGNYIDKNNLANVL